MRSLGESLPLGEKLRFIPRGTVEAACVPPLWSSDNAGVTDADAAGARTTAVKPMARPDQNPSFHKVTPLLVIVAYPCRRAIVRRSVNERCQYPVPLHSH